MIIPIYNEEEVIQAFYQRMEAIVKSMESTHVELLFIDDGSCDQSSAIVRSLPGDLCDIRLVSLSRNFGKEAALSAGIDHAEGEVVVIIDVDLQDPPELIPEMIRLWREGFDVVYGQRVARDGETWLKRTTADLFYRLMSRLGRTSIPRDAGDFRLLSRRSVAALRQLPESNRFMKGLFSWIGYRQVALRYRRDPREAGESKFNYWKLWNFALDGITSFTTLPLKIATYLGALLACGAFLYGTYVIMKTLIWGDAVPGYPSLMTVILFTGGVQLLFMGVLGEYLGRMFEETKRRPLYLVDHQYFISRASQEKEPLNDMAEREASDAE